MKFWIEAELEKGEFQVCKKCETTLENNDRVFCEFELKSGALPNPQDLHPEPTGLFICPGCASNLI